MENCQDAVVIGGGPCGSFSALHIAKKEVKVTVFEEHREIGVPSHCAGHVSVKGLKRLGLYPLPNEIVENIFYGAKIYSPCGFEFLIRSGSPVTCAINRTLFDKHVARLAEKSGVHYHLNSRVESLNMEGSCVTGVNVRRNGKTVKVPAKVVLDAEGLPARMLKQTGLTPPKSSGIVKGFQAEVENVKDVEQEFVEVFFGKSYAPGFYAWLIPKRNNRAKVGLAAKEGNPKELLQKLMKKHPAASQKLRGAKILKGAFHPITLGGPISKAYLNGFLVVGDAASHVKPTTGGGLILGLNCAKIAAEVVSEALKRGDFSSEFLSTYQKRFMKLLGFDMNVMLWIRKMLDKTSDKKLDAIMNFYRRICLEKTIGNLEEIDFQGRAILKKVKSPKVLAAIAYFLSLIYL
ncbi:MAG: NAD(P)/FAD-dependent oxidoreductase [Nitrososphaerota archaeon]|nr:NAD(P)/FAD-dependent oxidoreductase [Candidatus Bathyarchaeota archaeon]MDW8024143.1 NAD(P)/FAD-dependent oxidoreductase [Nitrososphaerota archaeon]